MHIQGKAVAILATFLSITFILTYTLNSLQPLLGNIHVFGTQPLAAVLASYGPAIGAIITTVVFHEDLAGFGWGPGKLWFYLFAIAFPFIFYLVFYGVFFLAGYFWVDVGLLPGNIVPYLTLNFLAMFILALGEEIGWRGFLVPHVAGWTGSFVLTGLVTGLVWALWHYPFLFSRSHGTGEAFWSTIFTFTIGVIAISFVYTWLRLASGSLWPCVVLHAVSDWFGSFIILKTVVPGPVTSTGAGGLAVELGINIFFALALAIIFYSFRRTIPDFPGTNRSEP